MPDTAHTSPETPPRREHVTLNGVSIRFADALELAAPTALVTGWWNEGHVAAGAV